MTIPITEETPLKMTAAPTQEKATECETASSDSDSLEKTLRREAAQQMGRATTEAKRAAVRENGKKGGRPPGSHNSPEVKARMQEAQRRRRKQEQNLPQTQD